MTPFLLSEERDCLLFFNLSEESEDEAVLPALIRGFFGALDFGVGLVDRASRLFDVARLVSGEETSMDSSDSEDLGLTLDLAFPEGEEGEGVLRSLLFVGEGLLDCSLCLLSEMGEELTLLDCFRGGVEEEVSVFPSPPFIERFVFEVDFFNCVGWCPGSGLRVLPLLS